MGERKISDIARKVSAEEYLHKVMEILEAEDGRTFEEKKCEVIELLKCWKKQGIGYKAIKAMLTELKERLNINEFRIKVEPDNYASQRLFEKLGAVPYGIVEFMLHKEKDIIRCEEENMDAIDAKLVTVAEKFGVEPRKLLSHVLEYELKW